MHSIFERVRAWAGQARRSNETFHHRSRFEVDTVHKIRDGHIQGWFSEQEGIYLQRLLENIKTMEGAIVELGSYMGLSSCYLGAKCKQLNQKLICIDTFTGSEEHQELLKQYNGSTRDLFIKNITYMGILDSIETIQFRTLDAVERIKERIKFIFIDADHSYEGVKNDFEAYYPLVVKNGIISLHDCGEFDRDGNIIDNFGWAGPTKVYYELKQNKNLRQITLSKTGFSVRAFEKLV